MNTKASILLLAAGLCATSTLQAQKIKGTRALPILEYAQSAQTAALGGNHYGESDVSHLYTNPTSLLYGETVLSLGGGLRTLGKVEGFDGTNNLYNASLGICVGRHAFFGGFRYLGGMKYTPIDQNENAKKKMRQLFDYTVDLGYLSVWASSLPTLRGATSTPTKGLPPRRWSSVGASFSAVAKSHPLRG